MASNYNALGFNLMTTGENAGTWGDNTNLNLNYLRDTLGYITVAMTADRTLTIPDNSTGTYDGRAFIIECTGALGANRVLDIAATAGSGSSPGGSASILKPFIVYNNTSTSYTLTFKVTGATGFELTQGKTYLCYHNGTDIINTDIGSTNLVDDTTPQLGGNLDVNGFDITSASNADVDIIPNGTGDVVLGADTVKVGDAAAAVTLTSNGAGDLTVTTGGTKDLILNTNSGTNSSSLTITDAAGGDITVLPNGAGDFVIAGNSTQAGTLVLGADTDDTGTFVASFAPGVLTESTAYTLPTAFAGTTGDVMTSTDAGVLSWATPAAGGTSWQAVVVGAGGSSTAVAGEGYFINTTANTHTLNLPTSPTIGDEVNAIDYAGTFDTNNLTVGRGGEKIHGAAADLTVATERAGFALVYTDGTQGWLLKDK